MAGSPIDPSFEFIAVTPTDNAQLQYNNHSARAKAFYIGGTGNLAVQDVHGVAVTFTNLLAGVIYPISSDVVMATNTTATGIIALF